MPDSKTEKDKPEEDKIEKGWEYYKKVNKALTGLFEILTMNFSEEDLFYKCGVDNLTQLKEVILDLLTHDYNPAEIKRKLRDLEFDMKKCLFFSSDEDKEENEKEEKGDTPY